MGATAMTNNHIIPITAGVRGPKRSRVAVRTANGPEGIEIHAELLHESAAMPPQPSIEPVEVSGDEQSIHFRSCSEVEEVRDRTYWIASDHSVKVCAAGQAEPAGALASFSNVEELMTVMSDWHMPRLVSVWNQIPGVRKVTRFANCSIALKRLWQAIDGLPQQVPVAEGKRRKGENKKRAGQSKLERLIGLLRTPGGVTMQVLMEASGWQAHSVRGFLSGKLGKQLGLPVESFRRDGERVYALPPAAGPQEQPE